MTLEKLAAASSAVASSQLMCDHPHHPHHRRRRRTTITTKTTPMNSIFLSTNVVALILIIIATIGSGGGHSGGGVDAAEMPVYVLDSRKEFASSSLSPLRGVLLHRVLQGGGLPGLRLFGDDYGGSAIVVGGGRGSFVEENSRLRPTRSLQKRFSGGLSALFVPNWKRTEHHQQQMEQFEDPRLFSTAFG